MNQHHQGWIGVDLDGTLAHYDTWKGTEHIGAPVQLMADRVRQWVKEGLLVKIFTARVSIPEPGRSATVRVIHRWLEEHGLPALEVTNIKDLSMIQLWDDRAIRVEANTGRVI